MQPIGGFIYKSRFTIKSIAGWLLLASLAHETKLARQRVKDYLAESDVESSGNETKRVESIPIQPIQPVIEIKSPPASGFTLY